MNKKEVAPKPTVLHNGWAKKRIAKFTQKCVELGGDDFKQMLSEGVNVDHDVTELGVAKISKGKPVRANKRKEVATVASPPPPNARRDLMQILQQGEQELAKRPRAQPQNKIQNVDPRQGGSSAWALALGATAFLSKFI